MGESNSHGLEEEKLTEKDYVKCSGYKGDEGQAYNMRGYNLSGSQRIYISWWYQVIRKNKRKYMVKNPLFLEMLVLRKGISAQPPSPNLSSAKAVCFEKRVCNTDPLFSLKK